MPANSVNHSDSQPWRLSICLGLLVLVWAGLYLPRLGTEQLRFEEGRRALAAREMMESQSYFHQTVLGRAYLNKPPTFTWFIVGTSTIFGGMSEFSIRFPSVLATFLTALLVFFFDRGYLPRQTCFLAALIFLMTLMTVEKGALGEIEALLTLCIWLSVWAWWHGYQSNRLVWWILSGMGLGSAIALKGPAALVFFYGTVIPFCWIQGRRRWLISIPHGLIVGLAVLLNGGWILPLFFLADADTILATWEGQILREGIRYNFLDWISNQGEFIFTALVSFLPGSVLFLAYIKKKPWQEIFEKHSLQAFLFCLVVSGFFFFLFFPDTRARYIYPLGPAIALFAAIYWGRLIEKVQTRQDRFIFRFYKYLFVFLGTAAGAVALIAIPFIESFGWLVGLTSVGSLLAAGFLGLHGKPSWRVIGIQLCVLFFLLHIGIAVRSAKREIKYHFREAGKQINEFVPQGNPLYTLSWSEFNVFYYSGRQVRFVESMEEIAHSPTEIYLVYHKDLPTINGDVNVIDSKKVAVSSRHSFILAKVGMGRK